MKRKNGFYWVKYKNNWLIAQFCNPILENLKSYWLFIGSDMTYIDGDFDQIDKSSIERENKITKI